MLKLQPVNQQIISNFKPTYISEMNRIFLLLVLSLFSFVSCSADSDEEVKQSTDSRIPLGDPFIMLWNNKYYAYGTQSENGIAVYVSDDLKTWSVPTELQDGLALRKEDVWAERWFWAPEVYAANGKFYMYYSADEHICVATSDSPTGPFRQEVQKPMLETEKSIDNSLFIDDNGTPYLFWVRFNDGNNVWVAQLDKNLTDLKPESFTACIHVSQPWEQVWPRVNEGPFVMKRNGIYYMTYSANSYESQMYGVGVATATNVNGPWTKYTNNPVFQKPGDLVGVGHSALFTDKEGKLRIVFHAHNSTTKIHPRHMYIGTVNFESKNGQDVMTISTDYITPQFKKP